MSGSPYLMVEDVAVLLGCSKRTVHERARLGEIPHRRPPAARRSSRWRSAHGSTERRSSSSSCPAEVVSCDPTTPGGRREHVHPTRENYATFRFFRCAGHQNSECCFSNGRGWVVSVCGICGGKRVGLRCGRPCSPGPFRAVRGGESLDGRVPIPALLRRDRHTHRDAAAYIAARLSERVGGWAL
jgi:hypothetical protein